MKPFPSLLRSVLLAASLFVCTGAAFAATAGERILMPQARFSTGDNSAWREPLFDDSSWKLLSTSQYYEPQGFEGYDGYSWYRIHVLIPSTLKASSDWPHRLRVYLSGIDDADETYLNGVLIGKTGRMPSDPGGYDGRWQAMRDYSADIDPDRVRWDRDNVIAVRVYDGGGGGGFYKGVPYLALQQRVDGLKLDAAQASYRFLSKHRVQAHVRLLNLFPVAQRGVLQAEVRDPATGGVLLKRSQSVLIAPGQGFDFDWTVPSGPGIQASYRFVDAESGNSASAVHAIPYRLTPADSPRPALHAARLLGARPGTPLHHLIAATGRAPLRYSARGLPAGLTLDAGTGIISGTVPAAGEYKIQIQVSNALGQARREWTLVAGERLALTPPMGWNSWSAYGVQVSDAQLRKAAQVFVDQGLAAKGWNFINIDDGWESDKRLPDGEIASNERFPDMEGLSRFLHDKGLHLGLYSSPGATTCGGYLGSLGHELQDARTYARWGVDYLKYDLCSYVQTMSSPPTLEQQQRPYQVMGEALRQQPRSIVYSLCQYGQAKVWTWGESVGAQTWRMTDDIVDSWDSLMQTGFALAPNTAVVAPGRWNDPDTLVVGQVGWGDPRPSRLTPDEQYSHVSLWSLLAAPLLLGNDLPSLDAFTHSLITNHEVIAINQDALGLSAQRVLDQDQWQVWVKELEDGSRAVGVFNMDARYRSMRLDARTWGALGAFKLRDVWRQQDLGSGLKEFTVKLPAHGVMLFVVK